MYKWLRRAIVLIFSFEDRLSFSRITLYLFSSSNIGSIYEVAKPQSQLVQLITYDENKKKHYHFMKDITNDQLINKFIAEPIENQLLDSSLDTKIEIGSSYLVGEQKNLIGYIRFNELILCVEKTENS